MEHCDPEGLNKQLAANVDANFHHLFDCHKDEIFTYLRYMLHHPQDAEDILQIVFYKTYKAMRSFTPERWATFQPKPWLFTIAHHEVVNYRHYVSRTPSTSIDQQRAFFENTVISTTLSPEDEAERKESQTELHRHIHKLSEPLRVAVVLHEIMELPYKEVAEILGLSENTVKSNGRRGFKKLQQMMKEEVK